MHFMLKNVACLHHPTRRTAASATMHDASRRLRYNGVTCQREKYKHAIEQEVRHELVVCVCAQK
jgi:hypothetical protein